MSKQEEYEEKFKSEVYGKINQMIQMQSEWIAGIQKMNRNFDLENDLSNIGITMNNKLVELKNIFQHAGISIYSQQFENYGTFNLNFTTASFIGKSIINDLLDYTQKGMNQLGEYSKRIRQISEEKIKKSQALEKTSYLRRLFSKIKTIFKPTYSNPWTLTQEEKQELESILSKYREIGSQLYTYNLRDNIVSSIVKEVMHNKYSASEVPGLLEESVIPNLQKLGLTDLIPNLQQAISEEYKEDLFSTNIKDKPLVISILDKTDTQDFEQLKSLLRKFTIDTYIRNKEEFARLRGNKKFEIVNKVISELDGQAEQSILSSEDTEQLKSNIDSQIKLASELIEKGKNENSEARYYVLKDGDKIVAFQQAQLVKGKNDTRVEGWRNLAYAEQEYAGKTGKVINSNGEFQEDVYSEIIYRDISKWFQENGVNYERTCTGVNMLANIATYMRIKGFLPFDKDEKQIFLEKFVDHKIDTIALSKAYNLYCKNKQRTEHKSKEQITEEVQRIAEFEGLTEEQKKGLVRSFLKEDEKEFEIPEGKSELFNELITELQKTRQQKEINQDDLKSIQDKYGLTAGQLVSILKGLEQSEQRSNESQVEEKSTKSTQELGKETLAEQKDTETLDEVEKDMTIQEKIIDDKQQDL